MLSLVKLTNLRIQCHDLLLNFVFALYDMIFV